MRGNTVKLLTPQDLIEVTNDEHYERYRSEKLTAVTGGLGPSDVTVTRNVNPLQQIEREREEKEKKLKTMESEMEQVGKTVVHIFFEINSKQWSRKWSRWEKLLFIEIHAFFIRKLVIILVVKLS